MANRDLIAGLRKYAEIEVFEGIDRWTKGLMNGNPYSSIMQDAANVIEKQEARIMILQTKLNKAMDALAAIRTLTDIRKPNVSLYTEPPTEPPAEIAHVEYTEMEIGREK